MQDEAQVRQPWLTAGILIAIFLVLAALPSFVRAEGKQVGGAAPKIDVPIVWPQAEDAPKSFVMQEAPGKIVLVEFWATWCSTCRTSAPRLEQYAREVDPSKVQIVSIVINDSPQKAIQFAQKNGLSYPIAVDSDGDLAREFGIRSIPTFIAIDATGVVRGVKRGMASPSELSNLVESAR